MVYCRECYEDVDIFCPECETKFTELHSPHPGHVFSQSFLDNFIEVAANKLVPKVREHHLAVAKLESSIQLTCEKMEKMRHTIDLLYNMQAMLKEDMKK